MTNFSTPRKVATTVTANGALAKGKHTPVNAAGGAVTLTLPTGANEGSHLSVEKIDTSTNTVAITGNIRGSAGSTLALAWQYESVTLVADSTGSWWPMAGHKTKAALDLAFGRIAGVPRARGAMCFTWDDGFPNWLSIAQAASLRGQRHTFCVQTDKIDAGSGITSADVRAIAALGHEIASHSKTHAAHNAITSAQRAVEFDTSKSVLEGLLGAGTITTYVYPVGSTGNARDNTCDRECFGRYDRVRDTNGTGFTPIDSGRRGAFVIPCRTFVPDEIMDAIRVCATQPLIFTTYAHNPDGLVGGSPDITMAQALAAMDLAQQLGVPCITLREAFPSANLVANGCMEHGASGLGTWRNMGDAGASTIAAMVNPPTGIAGANVFRVTPTTSQITGFRQLIPVEPGATYQVGYLMRMGVDGAGATIQTGGIAQMRWGTTTDYVGSVAGWNDGTSISGRAQYLTPTLGDKSGAWNLMGSEFVIPADKRFVEIQFIGAGIAGLTFEVAPHIWVGKKHLGNFG